VHHLGAPDAEDPEALEAFPVLAALEQEGMVLWFYAAPDQLALLPGVLERLPALKVMLNHLGFCQQGYQVDEHGRPRIPTPLPPPTLPAVLDMARFPNVHVMFSGQYAFSREPYPYDDVRHVGVRLHEAFGADRLMWASDYPWIREEPGYRRMLDLVDHALPGLSADERSAVTGGTAARLLRF
jgi:predicted TIM-barrel fold metal-dependent hydrolase